MCGHEDPFRLMVEDTQGPAYRLLEHPSDFHSLSDQVQEFLSLIEGLIETHKRVLNVLTLPS